jgi:hypothetical protein
MASEPKADARQSIGMSKQDIQYLQRKAEQFRKVASDYHTPISLKLLQIAQELEDMAVELVKRQEPAETASPCANQRRRSRPVE